MKRILIAGIGNIFFGDDAFGVEVAAALMQRSMPEGVRVVDFGIRSYDLAYALVDGYDAMILVDAVSRGEPPGTVFLIEPELGGTVPDTVAMAGSVDAHSMNPLQVLEMARSLGGQAGKEGRPPALYLVGCEPAVLESDTGEIGLSSVVRAAVPGAIGMIENLIADLLQERGNDSIPPHLSIHTLSETPTHHYAP